MLSTSSSLTLSSDQLQKKVIVDIVKGLRQESFENLAQLKSEFLYQDCIKTRAIKKITKALAPLLPTEMGSLITGENDNEFISTGDVLSQILCIKTRARLLPTLTIGNKYSVRPLVVLLNVSCSTSHAACSQHRSIQQVTQTGRVIFGRFIYEPFKQNNIKIFAFGSNRKIRFLNYTLQSAQFKGVTKNLNLGHVQVPLNAPPEQVDFYDSILTASSQEQESDYYSLVATLQSEVRTSMNAFFSPFVGETEKYEPEKAAKIISSKLISVVKFLTHPLVHIVAIISTGVSLIITGLVVWKLLRWFNGKHSCANYKQTRKVVVRRNKFRQFRLRERLPITRGSPSRRIVFMNEGQHTRNELIAAERDHVDRAIRASLREVGNNRRERTPTEHSVANRNNNSGLIDSNINGNTSTRDANTVPRRNKFRNARSNANLLPANYFRRSNPPPLRVSITRVDETIPDHTTSTLNSRATNPLTPSRIPKFIRRPPGSPLMRQTMSANSLHEQNHLGVETSSE